MGSPRRKRGRNGYRMIKGDDAARFRSKYVAVGECLEWQGALSKYGYGKFMVGGKGHQVTWPAHRWAYKQHHGTLPDLLRHTCDNTRCVRVDHLVPGDQYDNVHDALDRRRRRVALNPALVKKLRSAVAQGKPIRAVARRLGLNYQTAYAAATRKTWRRV